jgi:hypothetical protein
MREMLRVMGLDPSLVSLWRNPNTLAAYSPVSSILYSMTIRGKITDIIATPNLIAAVQAHFSCPNAPGA